MGSHEDDDAVHKGRLRSIWTHTVDISRLQGQQQQGQAQQQQHGRAYSPPGSPSKAFISSAAAQALLPGMRAPGGWCLLGRLDREVLCNALACAGASMADPLMSMVDTYFSGQLGTTALAALGSNGALFSVMYFLCFTALAVLCTQAMASANSRGDAEGVGRGFLQALAATAVVAVLLVTLLLLLPEQLLGFFQTNAEVMPYAKTYCMIRALSLPAALAMNVCQAAFRSLLDLSTPFAVVMAANAANYALDSLLMLRLGWGMAGCGIASVVSQYIGAGLFAAIIVRRRHQFGIPEALARAADRAEEAQQQQQQQQQQQSSSSCEAAAGKQQLWWRRLRSLFSQQQQPRLRLKPQPVPGHCEAVGSPGSAGRAASGSFRINVFGSPQSQQSPARAAAAAVAAVCKEASGSLRIHVPGSGSSGEAAHPVAASSSARMHAGMLQHRSASPDLKQHHAQHQWQQQQQGLHGSSAWQDDAAVCSRGDADLAPGGSRLHRRPSSAGGDGGSRRESMDALNHHGFAPFHSSSTLHQQQQQQQLHSKQQQQLKQQQSAGIGGSSKAAMHSTGFARWSGLAHMWQGKDSSSNRSAAPPAAADQPAAVAAEQMLAAALATSKPGHNHSSSTSFAAGGGPPAWPSSGLAAVPDISSGGSSSSSSFSGGSGGTTNNTLPRVDSVGSDSKLPRLQVPSSTVQRLLLLLASLEWRAFVGRFLGMSLRGLLILSTYSTASMVAARAGTASLAAHQVVQQQQQLQMSFAWSFLHVGQSMTANVFHAAPAAGGGPRAARRLATRIVRWAAVSCAVLAMLTYHNRQLLSGLFTRDAAVRQLVGGAVAPATIMLGLAWNNALEGCLLGADDQPFVVKVYPYAVAAALLQLGRAWLRGLGLPGVWWGLVGYYLVLLAGFGGRFFLFRGRI